MTNPRDDLMALATNHTEVLWRKAQEARMTRNNGLAEQYADEARQWEDACRAASRPATQVVDREAVARAICQSGKFETGEGTCALLCMDQLGSPRKKGCCHSARVHGKLADAILSLLRPAEDEIEQMASRPLYTHPPKSPEMIELLKLAYDNMFDGEAREQVRRKLFE